MEGFEDFLDKLKEAAKKRRGVKIISVDRDEVDEDIFDSAPEELKDMFARQNRKCWEGPIHDKDKMNPPKYFNPTSCIRQNCPKMDECMGWKNWINSDIALRTLMLIKNTLEK